MTISIALDLGTTRIKSAILRNGKLENIFALDAPKLYGNNYIRESSAIEYIEIAKDLLYNLTSKLPKNIKVGIASQRSTFLLWEKKPGNC